MVYMADFIMDLETGQIMKDRTGDRAGEVYEGEALDQIWRDVAFSQVIDPDNLYQFITNIQRCIINRSPNNLDETDEYNMRCGMIQGNFNEASM